MKYWIGVWIHRFRYGHWPEWFVVEPYEDAPYWLCMECRRRQ